MERRCSTEVTKGDVTLCIRFRPGPQTDACVVVEAKESLPADAKDCVRLLAAGTTVSPGAFAGRYDSEVLYRCDHAFGPETSQEQVYSKAVAPIAEAVIRGYNGAVIAYGQTGSGKTHTMVGSRTPEGQGVAPRAVSDIFEALAGKPSWMVAVTALEIYNERVRDLLSPGGAAVVEIHECCSDDQRQSFRCPDATMWPARSPAEALEALEEVVRRRETASTDMNDRSSRSHLVFTVCVWQGEAEDSTALHSRLHLVDLAGSERLKRTQGPTGAEWAPGAGPQMPRGSFTHGSSTPGTPLSARPSHRGSGSATPSLRSPRSSLGGSRGGSVTIQQRPREQQRREAVDINKSLSQLALVIQRLTMAGPPQYVPYRDSMLTRLLAESFGGSSKTCLIIACSPFSEDREETRSSLDFGRRAKLVRNRPRINAETKEKPAAVVRAFMTGEFPNMEALPLACQKSPAPHHALAELQPAVQCAAGATEDCQPQQPALPSGKTATTAAELSPPSEQAAAPRVDLSLLLPRPLSEAPQDAHLRAALAEAAEARAEAAEARAEAADLRRRLEVEATEKRQLHERLMALLEEGRAMPCSSSRKAAEEAMRLEKEKAGAVARFEEQIVALRLGWEDDVRSLEAEKGVATRTLKASLARRYQEDAALLRESQASELARAEAEKATLRDEWQTARAELHRLQEQQAATEVQLAEARAAEPPQTGHPAGPQGPALASCARRPQVPHLALHCAAAASGAAAAGEPSCEAWAPHVAGGRAPSAKRTCWEPEAPEQPARQAGGVAAPVERSLEQVLYGAEAGFSSGADVAAGSACGTPAAGCGRGVGSLGE